MWSFIAPAFRLTFVLTVLTGLIYPAVVTGVAQTLFASNAHGSLVSAGGKVVGSALIGQNFSRPEYLHPRPSAAGQNGYDASASLASNYGPTNQKLIDRVTAAAAQYRRENPDYNGPIPADALTASASGLDPDISPANADIQAARVAQARHVDVSRVREMILRATERPWLGFIGEPRVNVLLVNLALDEQIDQPRRSSQRQEWQYGGFVDAAFIEDPNDPANNVFRSRGTAWHVNDWHINMAAIYARKRPTDDSRWGAELTAQEGKDDEMFGFSATAPNLKGSDILRHLGPTNVSYLAPVGKGLTLQGGIFSSFIGYDSLYARDNFNYTRPWGADFTPYFMLGVNAQYPVSDRLNVAGFVVNGYWHLADANSVPSVGGQVAYKLTPRDTLKETVLWGPHQANTSIGLWRFITDTIVEHKTDPATVAFEYTMASEKLSSEQVDAVGEPTALWMSAQLPVRWNVHGPWTVAVRPEVAWDRDGRWTLASQTVKAFTTTVEYKIPYKWSTTILRGEYRVDDSRGPQGGFFKGGYISPGMVGLTPTQNLFIAAAIFSFDSPAPK